MGSLERPPADAVIGVRTLRVTSRHNAVCRGPLKLGQESTGLRSSGRGFQELLPRSQQFLSTRNVLPRFFLRETGSELIIG